MSNVYDFRPGRSVRGCDPQQVGEALERIRKEKEDVLLPADVVEAAAAEDHPLHPAFEWDDSVAAHQYRLTQARRIIASIRVFNPKAAKRIIAYVSVRTQEKSRNYVPVAEALTDDVLKERVLSEVLTFIESLQKRYAHFEEVSKLLQKIQGQVG